MRFRHLAIAVALMLPAAFAEAELPDTVKIGILNDMNGPFADQSGKGSVVTAHMAAEDFAEERAGFKVEILSADHLNKPDVGAQIVRAWVDRDDVSAVAELGELRCRTGGEHGNGGEASHLYRHQCRDFRPHRQVLPADYSSVDDGHLRVGHHDGPSDGRAP